MEVCTEFTGVTLVVPIITAYETKETQTSKTLFGRFKRDSVVSSFEPLSSSLGN